MDAVQPSTCPTCMTCSAPPSSALHRLRSQDRPANQALQARCAHPPVAQDADDAVRNRPSVDHVQDACNLRSPQQHVGVVHSQLNLHRDHAEHQCPGDRGLQPRLGQSGAPHDDRRGRRQGARPGQARRIGTAMRMLDNVIDINYYAVAKGPQLEPEAPPGRPGPDGLPGRAVPDAHPTPRRRRSSSPTARWRRSATTPTGPRPRPPKSAAATRATTARCGKGILPLDSPSCWPRPAPGGYVEVDTPRRWTGRRCACASATTACATQLRGHRADRDHLEHHRRGRLDRARTTEPLGQVQPVGRVHRGQRVPGARPEEAGLWDDIMVMDLKYFDGSLRRIDRVPGELGALRHRLQVEPWLVEAASRRQKWIDQAQSLNIYMAGARAKADETHKLAWIRGLKTTYYLRTMGATRRREVDRPRRPAQRGQRRRQRTGQSPSTMERPLPPRRRRWPRQPAPRRRPRRQSSAHRRPWLRSMP